MAQVLRGPGENACQAAPLLLPGPGWWGAGVQGRRHTTATGAGEGSGRRRCRRRKTGKHAQDTGMEASWRPHLTLQWSRGLRVPAPKDIVRGARARMGTQSRPTAMLLAQELTPNLKTLLTDPVNHFCAFIFPGMILNQFTFIRQKLNSCSSFLFWQMLLKTPSFSRHKVVGWTFRRKDRF